MEFLLCNPSLKILTLPYKPHFPQILKDSFNSLYAGILKKIHSKVGIISFSVFVIKFFLPWILGKFQVENGRVTTFLGK